MLLIPLSPVCSGAGVNGADGADGLDGLDHLPLAGVGFFLRRACFSPTSPVRLVGRVSELPLIVDGRGIQYTRPSHQ